MKRLAATGTALAMAGALAAGGAVYAFRAALLPRPAAPRAESPDDLRVTVREGLRKEEVAAVLAGAGVCSLDALLAAMNDPTTIAAFGVPAGVPGGIDGYLFPDTYRFAPRTPAPDVLKRMRARLDEIIDARMRTRMAELGWDLHTTLTLAAIIEKETGVPDERARVAAVFHNRLAKKMKLQTDPTVLYGMPLGAHDLKRDDLKRPHPYNTYVVAGLPPGPIAQPGRASIEAALWPMPVDDLFFVAKGDTGAHEFCPTVECHNAAVEKWQIQFYAKKRKG